MPVHSTGRRTAKFPFLKAVSTARSWRSSTCSLTPWRSSPLALKCAACAAAFACTRRERFDVAPEIEVPLPRIEFSSPDFGRGHSSRRQSLPGPIEANRPIVINPLKTGFLGSAKAIRFRTRSRTRPRESAARLGQLRCHSRVDARRHGAERRHRSHCGLALTDCGDCGCRTSPGICEFYSSRPIAIVQGANLCMR
jgi:hypothetical protein